MRRTVAALAGAGLLACALVACSPGMTAEKAPPGIRESQWRPLGEEVGLVVQQVGQDRTIAWLMCKVDGRWVTVVLQDPAILMPAR